jgi:hypothetical protein
VALWPLLGHLQDVDACTWATRYRGHLVSCTRREGQSPALWSNGQEFLTTDAEAWVPFLALPDLLRGIGSGTGSTQPREYTRGINGVICVAEKQCVSSELQAEFLRII